MEELLNAVDKDWSTGKIADAQELDELQTQNMLSDMAKVLEGSGSGTSTTDPYPSDLLASLSQNLAGQLSQKADTAGAPPAPVELPPSKGISVRSSFPAACTVVAKVISSEQGRNSLLVKIHELRNIKSIADGNVDLQVSAEQVRFSTGPNDVAQISGPYKLMADSTRATFSRKRGVLTVEVDIV